MTQVKPTIHIASCSFGKDSIATILAGLEHGDPIDRVVFAEVMFDNARGISGEIPEHIEWIYNTAIPKMRGMGLTIDVVRSDMDYIDYFIQRRKSGKYAGKFGGFPLGGMCKINSACKVAPIHKYLKDYRATHDVIQYIGIAADEPKRLARLDGTTKISLLAKYNINESMAHDMCRDAGLLSPIYATGTRGGCWFCPNQRIRTMAKFRTSHPELWDELRAFSRIPNLCSKNFKYDKTFAEIERMMDVASQPTLFDEL